jgi:hypothetical protein
MGHGGTAYNAAGFRWLALVLKNLETIPTKRFGWLEISGILLGLFRRVAIFRRGVPGYRPAPMHDTVTNTLETAIAGSFPYGLVGVIPLAAWIAVQLSQTASVSARTLLTFNEMYFRFLIFWPQLNSALFVWLLPASVQNGQSLVTWIMGCLPVVALILLAVFSAWITRKSPEAVVNRGSQRCGCLPRSMLVSVAGLSDHLPPITIDNRMLSPAHVAVIWIVVCFWRIMWKLTR